MADEKKYTAQEAAIAVLKKTEEMLKSSKHKHIGWDKLHSKLEGEGYSSKSADKIAGSVKAKINKSDECSVCKAEDIAKAETGHEKGVHAERTGKGRSWAGKLAEHGKGNIGTMTADAKALHSSKLSELSAMPKPNLPKSEVIKAENPDEKQDAELGENVEHLCEDHMMANKGADLKAMPKPNLTKGEVPPGEIHPKEHMEGEAMHPGKRTEHQTPPGNNPHEKAEGNNPEWGTDPGVKGHIKLAHFMGHMSSKKKHAAPAIGASGGGMDKPEVTSAAPPVKKGICLS